MLAMRHQRDHGRGVLLPIGRAAVRIQRRLQLRTARVLHRHDRVAQREQRLPRVLQLGRRTALAPPADRNQQRAAGAR
eukprot:3606134-Prymnesium_polylepis.1